MSETLTQTELSLSTPNPSLQELFDDLQWLCYCLTRSRSPPVYHIAIALMSELFINWIYVSKQAVIKPCLKKPWLKTAVIQTPTDNEPETSVLQGQGVQLRKINISRSSSCSSSYLSVSIFQL